MSERNNPLADYKTADLVALLVEVRTLLDQEKRLYEESIKRHVDTQKKLEGEVLRRLADENSTTQKFESGKVTRVLQVRYSIADPEVFEKFVIEQGDSSYYTKAVSKSAVDAYKEEHGDLPPGLQASGAYTLRLTKA